MRNENELKITSMSFYKKISLWRRHPDGNSLIMALLCLAEIVSLGIILHNAGRFRFLLNSTLPGMIFFLLIVLGFFIISWIIYTFWCHKPYAKIAALLFSLILIVLALLHVWQLAIHYQQTFIEGIASLEFRAHTLAVLIITGLWLPSILALLFILPVIPKSEE